MEGDVGEEKGQGGWKRRGKGDGREGPGGLEEKRVNSAGLEMITYTDMSNVY